MAVPKVDGQFIAEAIKYIDENGVPWHNTSTKYELVWENGNTYPPKYVIAVANHLQNGAWGVWWYLVGEGIRMGCRQGCRKGGSAGWNW